MRHDRSKLLPGVQSPDIKIVSKQESTYSTVYGVSPLGWFYLMIKAKGRPEFSNNGLVVLNSDLPDLIKDIELNNLIVS